MQTDQQRTLGDLATQEFRLKVDQLPQIAIRDRLHDVILALEASLSVERRDVSQIHRTVQALREACEAA